MKNLCAYVVKILLFLIFAGTVHSNASERDYYYSGRPIGQSCDEDGLFFYGCEEFCADCFNWICWHDFNKQKNRPDVHLIPASLDPRGNSFSCYDCQEPTVYSGYLHFRYKGDYPFLKRQIAYTKKYPAQQHYWPETSCKAMKVNDLAIVLFQDLINSTALNRLKYNKALARTFITDSWYFESLDFTLPISLSICFRFSDFYQVSKDITIFSKENFNESESQLIQEKLDVLLEQLLPLFLKMYEESLSVYPTDEIMSEVRFIELLYNSDGKQGGRARHRHSLSISSQASALLKDFFDIPKADNDKEKPPALPDWLIADYWFYEGERCNDLFLHAEAITYLNASIAQDENHIEAYQERIHAHFEMGNLDLAIEDYRRLKQLEEHKKTSLACRFASNSEEYSQGGYIIKPEPKGLLDCYAGFYVGILQGCAVGAIEFLPSTLSCCKGILHGLWSFSCSPIEVSRDLIDASYELVKFIKEHTARENLELVIPELKEVCLKWDTLTDYERGNQIGYIIGKYGMDVLIPGAAIKGIKKYRELKRLNTMFTLECCVASEAKKVKIIEGSAKHASIRTTVVEAAKTGQIVAQNPNVAAHVMQKKHAWDRIIKLTGDTKEDFKKVVQLLNEKLVLDGPRKCIGQFPKGSNSPKINRYLYEIKFGSEVIEAEFIEYIATKEFYLNDAWIKTRQ